MKKCLSMVLCVAMVLSLSACGMDWTYCRGMNYISKGEYAAAYETLHAATHPNAAKELEKFIYVPLTHTYTSSAGDQTTTFTYDEMGYPTKIETVVGGNTHVATYVYEDTVLRESRITVTYADGDIYSSVYTYTEWGAEQDYVDYHNDSMIAERHTVYDKNRRVVKFEEKGADCYNWVENTYSEKGRKLTATGSQDGVAFTSAYTYAEDGTYVETRVETEVDKKWNTQVDYDKSGREIRRYSVLEGATDTRLDEYTYDKAGNEVTHYHKWGATEETTTTEYNKQNKVLSAKTVAQDGTVKEWVRYTYDEDGRVLTCERTEDGTTWQKDAYTYDDEGNTLSEYYTDPETGVVRDITYTYNEDGTLKTSEDRGALGSVVTTYGYDEQGNRVQSQSQDGQTGATATYQWFYYPYGVPQALAKAIADLAWE